MGKTKLQVMMHIVPKDCVAHATKDFYYREFDCTCEEGNCTETRVRGDLLEMVQMLRVRANRPLIITGGFRCAYRQQQLRENPHFQTSKGVSSHELGIAADIRCATLSGEDLAELATKVGFTNIGVGKDWIHVDLREGTRRWTYGS